MKRFDGRLNNIRNFNLTCLGNRRSGKTSTIRSIIMTKDSIMDNYEIIYIMCQPVNYDYWAEIIDKTRIYCGIDKCEIACKLIMKKQAKLKNNNKEQKKICIVFDDLMYSRKNKSKDFISQIAMTGRHYGLSTIFLEQTKNYSVNIGQSDILIIFPKGIIKQSHKKAIIEDILISYKNENQTVEDLYKIFNSCERYEGLIVFLHSNKDNFYDNCLIYKPDKRIFEYKVYN